MLNGINHVAILTNDTERLHAFYEGAFECEVCVENPDARPGVMNPPGTPAAGYQSNASNIAP